jgi:hypothetical protein
MSRAKRGIHAMAGTPRDAGTDRETESRRILDRVSREVEAGGALADRIGGGGAKESDGQGVDEDDWVEYWGTRIGRTAGLAFGIGLMLWLVVYLVRGG